MARYDGPEISAGGVSLVKPTSSSFARALRGADLTDEQQIWFERSAHDDACFFFGVRRDDVLVGQIFFHDAVWPKREALVGYHIFRSDQRGKGTGSAALALLCDYGAQELGLRRLIAITSTGNRASRSIASKVGFLDIGPAREGAHLVVYERRLS